MNFNTRIVLDLISLSEPLKESINALIDNELLLSNGLEDFTEEHFIQKLTLPIEELLIYFIKNELNGMGLSIIKKYINLNDVEYDILINRLTEI
jgi:hypothetical protein